MFAVDGESFLFQDSTGGVYRLGLDGKEIWKAGSNTETWRQTWTDGGLQIGPNGVVYAMKALGGDNTGPGIIRAYRIADGKFLWESPQTGEVPNAWPVIGRMRKGDPLTVIAPIGMAGGHMPQVYQLMFMPPLLGMLSFTICIVMAICRSLRPCGKKCCHYPRIIRTLGLHAPVLFWMPWLTIFITELLGESAQSFWSVPSMQAEVWGMDAETGKVLWKWAPPKWNLGMFKADQQRLLSFQFPCLPNPVGNPTVDDNGNFYIGMLDGFIYHLTRDSDGPGVKVESTFDTQAAFSSGGVMMAPGMMTIASCDTLFVFKGEAYAGMQM